VKKIVLISSIFLTALAMAQTASFEVRSVALPLVSVGQETGWGFDDDYQLRVLGTGSKPTILEVYSPEINRNDYGKDRKLETYFGDELFKTENFSSSFLLGDLNKPIARRTFGFSDTHTLQRIFEGSLLPGRYPFNVISAGPGKNSFSVRASGSVQFEASQFTVNLRGKPDQDQLVAFVNLPKSAIGQVARLSNYDADGESEMQMSLVLPDGTQKALKISNDHDLATTDISVTNENIGRWQVVARVLATTKQFSNAFGVKLQLEDQKLFATVPAFEAPEVKSYKVDFVDPKGNPIENATYTVEGESTRIIRPILPPCYQLVKTLVLDGIGEPDGDTVKMTSAAGTVRFVAACTSVRVNAVALLCNQRIPLETVDVSINDTMTQSGLQVGVTPGKVSIAPKALPGATTQAREFNIKFGQQKELEVLYHVVPNISISSGNVVLALNEPQAFTVSASTQFPYSLPATLELLVPSLLKTDDATRVSGVLSDKQALNLTVNISRSDNFQVRNLRATLNGVCSNHVLVTTR
jgi:hypothetical protein